MAQVKNNLVLHGISGKLADLIVFRRVGDKIVIAKKPERKPTTHPTLIAQNQRFKQASLYAKNALLDPSLKDVYAAEAKLRGVINPYNMALSDYLKLPEISNVDTSAYTGKTAAEPIYVQVSDNFKVINVQIIILNNDAIIEQGDATLLLGKWQYLTTVLNPNIVGSKIIVSATDRPAHKVVKEITL